MARAGRKQMGVSMMAVRLRPASPISYIPKAPPAGLVRLRPAAKVRILLGDIMLRVWGTPVDHSGRRKDRFDSCNELKAPACVIGRRKCERIATSIGDDNSSMMLPREAGHQNVSRYQRIGHQRLRMRINRQSKGKRTGQILERIPKEAQPYK